MIIRDATVKAERRHLTFRQKLLLAGGLLASGLLLIAAVAGFGFAKNGGAHANADGPARDTSGESVDARQFTGMILHESEGYQRDSSYTGAVVAARRTPVAFQRAGLVTSVLVDEGVAVSTGQPLAELDRRHLTAEQDELAARLAQATAQLAELRAGPREETIEAARSNAADLAQQLEQSRLRLERSQQLIESKSIARQDYEEQLFAKRALEARLQAAQSELDELLAGTRAEQIDAQQSLVASIEARQRLVEYQLDDCVLKSPFDGMIVRRWMDPGAVVSAGAAVLELVDHRNLEVHLGLPREIAGRLESGQTFAAIAGRHRFNVVLRTVLPVLDARTQTRRAVFEIRDANQEAIREPLVDGQVARVELGEWINERGFWIPSTALIEDHSGLWSCLTVKFGESSRDETGSIHRGVCQKQTVELLHQRGEWVYARGTPGDGEVVVASGLHRVVPGQDVQVRVEPFETPGGSVNTLLSRGSATPAIPENNSPRR